MVREQTKEQFAVEKLAHDEMMKQRKKEQREKRMAQEQTMLRRERERQEVHDRYTADLHCCETPVFAGSFFTMRELCW